jgi:ABC-type branched-subunit amino acid transport system substrate-binding protein
VIRHSVGSEPWRIGVLFSRTGVTAVIEQSQLQGTLLALEEVNSAGGINGRELVPVIYDPGSDPAKFARYAHKLLSEDRVTMIFGCYTSTSRKAVLPLVERWNGLLWYPTLYETSNTRPTSSTPEPRPTRTACAWPSI